MSLSFPHCAAKPFLQKPFLLKKLFPRRDESMFADRSCCPDLVASGRGTRRSECFPPIVCAALIPSHQGKALDVLTLKQSRLTGRFFERRVALPARGFRGDLRCSPVKPASLCQYNRLYQEYPAASGRYGRFVFADSHFSCLFCLCPDS